MLIGFVRLQAIFRAAPVAATVEAAFEGLELQMFTLHMTFHGFHFHECLLTILKCTRHTTLSYQQRYTLEVGLYDTRCSCAFRQKPVGWLVISGTVRVSVVRLTEMNLNMLV